MNLNHPYQQQIKLDIPEFQGCYADLIFLSVYKLIHNGPRLLKPIYKSIIAILSNIAPYTKKLSREASDGLLYLASVISKKEFLLEKEDNCKSMTSLFEAINYLIAYHDETNQYLQIQLMKNQKICDFFDAPDFEVKLTAGLQKQTAQPEVVIAQVKDEEPKPTEDSSISANAVSTEAQSEIYQEPSSPKEKVTTEVIVDKKEAAKEEEKVPIHSPEEAHSPSHKSPEHKPVQNHINNDEDDEGWEKQEEDPPVVEKEQVKIVETHAPQSTANE